jgi:uncharacterized membrane protein YoaK (UPF0700 family)
MSSLDIAVSPPIRRDETVQVSLLLAFAGGYLDAYAAMQTAIFTKVEAVTYSSAMITGNLRQVIEGLFAVVSGQFCSLRRPGIFAALCVAFGIGAAVGAYAMKGIPDLALGLPVVALLIDLFRCEIRPNKERP